MGALCPSSVPSAQLTVVGSNVIAQFNNKASSGDKSSLVQIATTGGTKPAAWNIGAAGACNAIKESAGMFYVQKTTSKKAAVVVSNAGNLGISTPSPKTSLQIGGSLSLHTLSVSTSYQMRATDYAVLAGASTSGIIVTLPPAATGSGMIVFVKKTDSSSFSVTVSASGSDNIEGSASMALKKQYDSLELISDGTTNWYILT